jgi:hypothetical protein
MDESKSLSSNKLAKRTTIIQAAGVIQPQPELCIQTEEDKRYTMMKKFEETYYTRKYKNDDLGCI